MKKGLMQLQTIIYVIFAVIILMAGIFSVQSYLTKLEIHTNYELENMDLSIIGKRTIGSKAVTAIGTHSVTHHIAIHTVEASIHLAS